MDFEIELQHLWGAVSLALRDPLKLRDQELNKNDCTQTEPCPDSPLLQFVFAL